MAKKKVSGPSIGLILTLIFFILATFITGTVAYFGYSEQEQFKAAEKKAQEELKTEKNNYREARARLLVERISQGVDDPADRVLLVSELDGLRPQIKDEYDRVLRGLDGKVPMVIDPKDPQRRLVPASTWRLLTMSSADFSAKAPGGTYDAEAAKSDPDARPLKTPWEMLDEYKALAQKAAADKKLAEDARDAAIKAKNESNVDKEKIELTFKEALDKIQNETKAKYAKIDTDYNNVVKKHENDASTYIKRAKDLGDANNGQADEIQKLSDKVKDLQAKLEKYENQNTGGRLNAAGVDFVNLEERKGQIIRKDDNGFVTINIGRSKKIKPQITFLVVSRDVSWLALLEKEDSLKRSSGRLDRQPFEDNPYVKAGIEVVEVLDNDTSRAKIIFENEPIRNPIQPRDQIFNVAWQPDEEMRIAFAGIIDLDGDGIDNNEDFLRLLERQGVIVDEYLKMKPLEFVKRDGKGMTLRTKYLVIAPDPKLDALPTDRDTPQTLQIKATIEKMSEIKARARELGVQMIEARKFLAMIGYKLPKNPAPPAYGAGVYLDQSAPPPAEKEKKDGQ